MKSLRTSQRLVTRREALAAGGAVALRVSLPNLVPAQQGSSAGPDVRGTLSRMTLADKVGQLLMACLDARTLEEKIDRYRCGSLLVWGNLKDVDALGLCNLTNRAQTLSLERRKMPLWLHDHVHGSPGVPGAGPRPETHRDHLAADPDRFPPW